MVKSEMPVAKETQVMGNFQGVLTLRSNFSYASFFNVRVFNVRAFNVVALLAGLFFCFEAALAAARTIYYPPPINDVDRKVSYPAELLRLALQHSAPDFKLQRLAFNLPQSRTVALLATGQTLSVMWTVTSPEREAQLRSIPVPIDRGLYGWRLLLIRQQDQARFASIQSLSELSQLTAGLGHDWPDLQIVQQAGLKAFGASSYDGLFDMLALGRIQYYPRAVPEVFAELTQRHSLNLAIAPDLVLRYPSAMFYFVAKNDLELAQLIQSGLEAAYADGSFQRLFDAQFSVPLAKAQLQTRRVFDIANPLLPDLRQRVAQYWWFNPIAAPLPNQPKHR